MTDENRYYNDNHDDVNMNHNEDDMNYREETAAEIAPSLYADRDRGGVDTNNGTAGRGVGYTALVISILSLFFMPIFLGAVGIIVGFIARARGAEGLGSWAIGIGAVAIILRLFFAPLTNFTLM